MRDKILRVRMSGEEMEAIARQASEERLATSSFLRCAALGRSRRTERRLPHPNAADLLALHRELRQVGNNLNQIAKRVNSGGGTHGLAEALAEIARATGAVREALS